MAELLSVVIPVLDSGRTIGKLLESLAGQRTDAPWEIVVADNGSTDDTLEVVDRYRERLPTVRVVDASGRRGTPHARNVGVEAAAGEQIAFLDSDDEVAAGFLTAMATALTRHELVAARLDLHRLNPAWVQATRAGHQVNAPLDWWLGVYRPFAYGGTIGVRRRLHVQIGGFDEAFVPAGEDMDYCWRLQSAGATLHFAADAVVHYRLRTSLRDVYRQARAYGECLPHLYRKHRPLGLPSPASPLRRGLVSWVRAWRHLPLAGRKARAARLAWDLGERVGIMRGAVRHRVLML